MIFTLLALAALPTAPEPEFAVVCGISVAYALFATWRHLRSDAR